jgi:hypothetical protein
MRMPLLIATAACAACFAAAPAAVAKTAPSASEFAQMDSNKDGVVSSGEHEVYARKMFDMVDTNHDDQITAEELDAADSKLSTHAAGPNGMSAAAVIRNRDTNGDGKVSQTEQADGARAKFIYLDVNNNGELTEQEYASGG